MLDSNYKDLTFCVPLPRIAHWQAQNFAQQQSISAKAKQIYLNTLAVYAVNYYLQCLGVETDLEASDSWDLLLQTLTPRADLIVKDKGKLECCFLFPNSEFMLVDQELWEERIGYVAVQLNTDLTEAKILGFTPQITQFKIPLNHLLSRDDLLKHLSPKTKEIIQLKEWFDYHFIAGWENLETLFNSSSLKLAEGLRTLSTPALKHPTVRGGKLVDLGMQLGKEKIALLMVLTQINQDKVEIRVQIRPQSGIYLPANLNLALLSEQEEILKEVFSRSSDNAIRLPLLTCNSGEKFSIQLTLGNKSIQEYFEV